MKKIFLILLAVSVFTSCSKSDSIDEQPPQDKSCKIQSFTHLLDETNKGSYDEYVSTFYYDSQNRFSKIENKYKNRIEFGRFIYEANTIKYSEDDLEITYTLNTKGLIVRSDSRSPYNTGGIQVNYTYCIFRTILHHHSAPKYTSDSAAKYTTFVYFFSSLIISWRSFKLL